MVYYTYKRQSGLIMNEQHYPYYRKLRYIYKTDN